MKLALVDDEARQLAQLRDMTASVLAELGMEAERLDTYGSDRDFFAAFEPDAYDIVILDIYMNDANGIDVARRIREVDTRVALAFCTSSNEFAYQSYEVDARYYLQKPISRDKVMAMFRRMDLEAIARNRRIRLPDGYRCPLRHILYTEYINHSVSFHLRDQKPHTVYTSHGDVERLLLAHKGFCVINKGCIVNFAQVRRLEGNAFLMQNGESVPIARRRLKEIEAAYTQYLFEKMDEEAND